MQFSPAAFNRFLGGIGQQMSMRRASACPCISPLTGGPDQNCPHCGGKGYAWASPIAGVAAAAGQHIQRQWAAMGQWEPGDIVVTIPADSPIYMLGMYDRVTMQNQSQPFSTILTRGASDTLPFFLVAVERVYWLDQNGAQVEGALPAVAPGGTFAFGAGGPAPGVQYSITGRRRPEFFCFSEYPQDRPMQMGAALPRRVVLRRFDLWGR